MATTTRTFTAPVSCEDEMSWAVIAELPGLHASGETLDELREALEEAISLYLTDEPDAGSITEMHEASEPAHLQVDELKLAVAC